MALGCAAVLAMIFSTSGAVAAPSTISRAASASSSAQRGQRIQLTAPAPAPSVTNPALTGCDAGVVQRLMEHAPSVRQWIIVITATTASTTATLQIATAVGDRWVCSLTATSARVGRTGIRPLAERRSGDGTTPSGIFPLGVVGTPQGPITFFGNSADPGVRGAYRRVQPGDCYGANPGTPGYGHWRVDVSGCTGDDELLSSFGSVYEHAVLIGANTEPAVSGDAPGEPPLASAIFLHRTSYLPTGASKPTSGCVSIGHTALVTAMRTIDPAANAHFAIGTRSGLLALPAAQP